MWGISKHAIQKIHHIFQQFPQIQEVIIFGSRAMGNYKQGSDIDLLIKCNNLTHELVNQIRMQLHDSDLPYIFDITTTDFISNPDLIQHIQQYGKIFYSSNNPKNPKQ